MNGKKKEKKKNRGDDATKNLQQCHMLTKKKKKKYKKLDRVQRMGAMLFQGGGREYLVGSVTSTMSSPLAAPTKAIR